VVKRKAIAQERIAGPDTRNVLPRWLFTAFSSRKDQENIKNSQPLITTIPSNKWYESDSKSMFEVRGWRFEAKPQ
jgi:hypothetical protein